MIPAPIAPTFSAARAGTMKPWWFGYWAADVCFVAAAVAAIVWGSVSSPFAFRDRLRWSVADTTHAVFVPNADTWVIYDERPGAADGTALPPPVIFSVRESAGTDVRVRPLLEPGKPASSPAYRDPWHEGRAVGEFDVTRTGGYVIQITPMPSGSFDATRFGPLPSNNYAIGRKLSTSWLNSPLALVPTVAVPIALGLALALTTKRRRSSAAAASTTTGNRAAAAAPHRTSCGSAGAATPTCRPGTGCGRSRPNR